jgi:hypothetical protein
MEPCGCNRWRLVASRVGARTPKSGQNLALCCDRLRKGAHGKEGVDGSSPSEGDPRPRSRRCQARAAPFSNTNGAGALAILVWVAEIDPLGTRRHGLDAFLDQKVEEGYVIETRSDTHAIIFRRPKGLKRFTSGPDPGRYVVQVDEDGIVTMRAAEPRRI